MNNMSIDFTLRNVQDVYDNNITHNVSPMWKLAGIYDDIYNSHGYTAKDILPRLEKGLQKMKEFPQSFEALNADNGWGNYLDALKFLEDIIRGCKEYPNSEIAISK